MADEYQYLPLDARRKEVRLLCFSWSFSTDGTSTLACTIEHASLLDELVPEYFAVSYCWGDAKKRASILVNGKVMSIPRTAELALRYLHDITGKGKASEAIAVRSIHNKGLRILKAFAKRHISPQKDHPPVRLWIDAICINQKDVAERQQQVTFMRDTYSWTSAETDNFRDLEDMILRRMDDKSYNIYSDAPLPSSCDWDALGGFFENPLFGRLWIIQDTVLGREVLCYLGRCSIEWGKVSKLTTAASWMIHRHYERPRYLGHESDGLLNVAAIRPYWKIAKSGAASYQLSYLLDLSHSFKATEPRDKVCGILGLAWSETRKELIPDYTRPLQEVFAHATRLAIKESKHLTNVRYVECLAPAEARKYQKDGGWPSWVPHWNKSWDKALSPYMLPLFYRASESVPMVLDTLQTCWNTLRVQGVTVDAVNAAAQHFESDERLWAQEKHAASLVLSLLPLATQAHHRRGAQSLLQSLGTCLTMGVDYNRNIVDPAFSNINLAALLQRQGIAPSELEPSRSVDIKLAKGKGDAWEFIRAFYQCAMNRRFFTTTSGHMGLGPRTMQSNDRVCILFGGQTPYFVRENGQSWMFVGECYVHDIMMGEFIKQLRDSGKLEAKTRWFDIV